MAENTKNLVQSAAKVFAVLRAFDPTLPELTITEVAGRAGLDRGTAFRLIHTLVSLGYLCPVPGSKRFRLALKCLELGFLALSSQDLQGSRSAVAARARACHRRRRVVRRPWMGRTSSIWSG